MEFLTNISNMGYDFLYFCSMSDSHEILISSSEYLYWWIIIIFPLGDAHSFLHAVFMQTWISVCLEKKGTTGTNTSSYWNSHIPD